MKHKTNILFPSLLLLMLLASCQNENIAVQRKVSFKVNPSEVINGFTYEVDEGELESFGSGYQLQIHLLVYDETGNLIATDVDYLSNYQSVMNSSLNLSDGEYIAVAITDVVKNKDGVSSDYWNITVADRLSDLKVSDAGNGGGKYKVLGISDYHFNVREGSDDHTIRVKPAGALVLVKSTNIHYYNTVERYKLGMNKNSGGCTFNRDGGFEASVENSGENYKWHLGYFEPQDYTGVDECYYYDFVLPLGRTAFQWLGKVDGSTWRYGGEKMTANIGLGEEYLVRFELGSDILAQMEIVNGEKVTD